MGYTLRNHVLRLCLRITVKLNFGPYIRRYTSPNENFEYSYPLSKGGGTIKDRRTEANTISPDTFLKKLADNKSFTCM